MLNQFNEFVLIIGAMKSGTTTIFDYLAEHPEIAPSTRKEPNFFANDDNFRKGMDWYRSLWAFNPQVHNLALEGSTHYTKVPYFPNAAERIASVEEANFKFIYIIRNPIDRIESHYAHLITSETTKDELEARSYSLKIFPRMIDTSRYAMQIEQYYNRFPRDSILLLDFDDLKKNSQQLLVETCDFLEIDSKFKFSPIKHANKSKGKAIDGSLWRHVEPAARNWPKIPKKVFRKIFSQQLSQKYKLTESQKELILKELKEDILKLNQEFGFNTANWGINF